MGNKPQRSCTKCRYPLLVAIGGATRSGKTTLSQSLFVDPDFTKYYELIGIIHQDHYFKHVRFEMKCITLAIAEALHLTAEGHANRTNV